MYSAHHSFRCSGVEGWRGWWGTRTQGQSPWSHRSSQVKTRRREVDQEQGAVGGRLAGENNDDLELFLQARLLGVPRGGVSAVKSAAPIGRRTHYF